MYKLMVPFAVCLATTACVTSAVPRTETVNGQVIDLACYMLDKANTSNMHRARGYACAQACAREGFQVGLLTPDGKVYQLTGGLAANKNAKLVPHLGHTVSIAGDVQEKDGIELLAADDLKMAAAR
jgi:hypothetical protein